MALTDDEFPVLNEVIRSGDESIIRSARLRRVGIEELDTTSTGPLHFELPAHLHFDLLHEEDLDLTGALLNHADTDETPSATTDATAYGSVHDDPSNVVASNLRGELEALIEQTIDKHMMALRSELKILLSGTHKLP